MDNVVKIIKKYIIIIFEFIKKILFKIIDFIKKIINKIKQNINIIKEKRKNNKKQNKVKIFFIGCIAYIGSVFSYLISKPKEKKEVDINLELKKINKNILNIEKSIENETTPLVLKIYKKEVNKKINKLKNIKNVKTREETKLIKENEEMLINIKDKIEIVENKLKNINYEEKVDISKREKELIKYNEIKNNFNKTVSNINKEKILSNTNKTISNTKNNLGKIKNKIKKGTLVVGTAVLGIVSNIIPKKQEKRIESKKTIKEINLLKEEDNQLKEQIKKLNNEINKTYNEINSNKIELNNLKEKVKKLKEEYIDLTNNKNFNDLKNYKNINSIDPNHLIYHDKSIDDLIDYLEIQINKQKKEINTKEQTKKEEINFDDLDIKLAKESIEKDIKLSIEDIKKIKVEMNNIPKKYKKPNLINKLSNFFKYSINVGISLIPFGIFKNKLLATLTSGVILNNRIRCMNATVNNEEIKFIQYENILSSLNNRKSCLENTNYILLDTVNQIDLLKLKLELMEVNDKEKDKLLISLDEMKLDLLEENLKIETMLEDVDKIKSKKIKKKNI